MLDENPDPGGPNAVAADQEMRSLVDQNVVAVDKMRSLVDHKMRSRWTKNVARKAKIKSGLEDQKMLRQRSS